MEISFGCILKMTGSLLVECGIRANVIAATGLGNKNSDASGAIISAGQIVVAQNFILLYRGFSIRRGLEQFGPVQLFCTAECNSAIQQIKNLRYFCPALLCAPDASPSIDTSTLRSYLRCPCLNSFHPTNLPEISRKRLRS
jgi:hypothetical protein